MENDGKLYAFDVNKEYTDIAKEIWKNAGIDDMIELSLDGGKTGLDSLMNNQDHIKSFDFAYVDAIKTDNMEYHELLLQLMKPGGIIAYDNVLRRQRVPDFNDINDDIVNYVRNFNQFLVNDNRIDMCMLNMGDGVTLVNVK